MHKKGPILNDFQLQDHCKKEHNCRPAVPCICGATLSIYCTYFKHKQKCFSDIVGIYKCDLCPAKYSTKSHISRHMSLKHKSDSIVHKCKTCNKIFRSMCYLRSHEITHLPDEVKKIHDCKICGRK